MRIVDPSDATTDRIGDAALCRIERHETTHDSAGGSCLVASKLVRCANVLDPPSSLVRSPLPSLCPRGAKEVLHEDPTERVRHMEGRDQGRKGHDLDRERCA